MKLITAIEAAALVGDGWTLARFAAEVRVAPQLRLMDPRIFHDRPMFGQGPSS